MTDEQHEQQQYRRGYLDGWAAGICALVDLVPVEVLAQNGRPVSAAYVRCEQHWRGELHRWACGDCSTPELAPDIETEGNDGICQG